MRYSHGKDKKSDNVWHWINVGMCLFTTFILLVLAYYVFVWLKFDTFGVIVLLILIADGASIVGYGCWEDEKYMVSDEGIHVKSWFQKRIIRWEQVKGVSSTHVLTYRFEEADYYLFLLSDPVSIPSVTRPMILFLRRKKMYAIRINNDRKAKLDDYWGNTD